jgi:hypothetical protein
MTSTTKLNQTRAQAVFMEWIVDILIYTVVLNIFIHYIEDFHVTNFMYSLATAVVLKALLVVVLRFEHKIAEWYERKKQTTFIKISKIISLWVVLFGSKFLILEVLDFVFRDNVDLHNIIALILMIITMMLAREAFNAIYRKLGEK